MPFKLGRLDPLGLLIGINQIESDYLIDESMECRSMVSIAAFGPRVLRSNTGWFAVMNSNQKFSF